MINGDAIQKIHELALRGMDIVEVDGRPVSRVTLHDARKHTEVAKSLVIHSLTGLVEYLQANPDGLSDEEYFIVIDSPTEVRLCSTVRGWDRKRETMVRAETSIGSAHWGHFQGQEDFLIWLLTGFEQGKGDMEIVQKLAGNITDEVVQTAKDDGVSQVVTAKKATAGVEQVIVDNPITLYPFRTFREVEQPEALAVLRFRTGPSAALFLADDSAWKGKAIAAIRDYLVEYTSGWTIVG